MSTPAYVIDVGDQDFATAVLEQSATVPVVADFWAPWCQPCRLLGPVLERLADAGGGAWLLAKVNIDEARQTATDYNINGIPAVKGFRDRRVCTEFVGVRSESEIRGWLRELVPSPADRLLRQAQLIEAESLESALRLLQDAHRHEPDHPGVRAALARVLLRQSGDDGADARAEELLAGLPTFGPHEADVDRVRAMLELRAAARDVLGPTLGLSRPSQPDLLSPELRTRLRAGEPAVRYAAACAMATVGHRSNAEPALETLLALIEADRDAWAEQARAACVRIFRVLGTESDLANSYRVRLTELLY